MKRLLFLMALIFACSPLITNTGVISLTFAGEIPAEAQKIASFEIRISKVVTPPEPLKIIEAPDSLTIQFDFFSGDNLPQGELPFTEQYIVNVVNNNSLWNDDGTATPRIKKWISLYDGNYELTIVSIGINGIRKMSGRYDFKVTGAVPIQVYINGITP